jgi:peptidoglycan hydrolase CwlO-like protein
MNALIRLLVAVAAALALAFPLTLGASGCERDEPYGFDDRVSALDENLDDLEGELEQAGNEIGDGARNAYVEAQQEWRALEASMAEAGDEISEGTREVIADIRERMDRLDDRFD